jgi:hypothetical protein
MFYFPEMRKQQGANPAPLHPRDVAVALMLVLEPEARYQRISEVLGCALSVAHAAVRRLNGAGLLLPGERAVNRRALLEFLVHGVRYAFPARPGVTVRGIPTAHAGRPLASRFSETAAPYVWPADQGTVAGASIEPLIPTAPDLMRRAPQLADLLTLVDACRVGQARERAAAEGLLHDALLT